MSKIKEISYTVQLDEKKRLMVKALIDTLYGKEIDYSHTPILLHRPRSLAPVLSRPRARADGVDNSSLLADEETVKRARCAEPTHLRLQPLHAM